MYDKRNNFVFNIVKFPLLMDIFLVLHHSGFLLHFYISQLIRFAALSLVLLTLTLVIVTKFKQRNFAKRLSVRHFQHLIDVISTWYQY